VGAATLASLDCPMNRRRGGDETGAQVEEMGELGPTLLARAHVHRGGGLCQRLEFGQAIDQLRFIADDAAVFPHQVSKRSLERAGQLVTGLDELIEVLLGRVDRATRASL